MPLLNAMIGSTEKEKTEWYNIIQRFKNKASEFSNAFNDLLNQQHLVNRYPELKGEYHKLIEAGLSIQSKIRTVTNTIDNVTGWIDSVFSGYDSNDNLGNLRAVPLIPIALVVGSVTLIANWILNYLGFIDKLKEIQRLEKEGSSPQEAYKLVSTLETQSKIKGIIQAVSPFLILGALFLLSKN